MIKNYTHALEERLTNALKCLDSKIAASERIGVNFDDQLLKGWREERTELFAYLSIVSLGYVSAAGMAWIERHCNMIDIAHGFFNLGATSEKF